MKPSQKTVKCIDWSQIVMDLEALGMTQRQIGAECGFREAWHQTNNDGKVWVNRLKNIPDTEPGFHQGALLLGLCAERMAKPLADLPRAEYRYVRNASGRITALPMVDKPVGADPDVVTDS